MFMLFKNSKTELQINPPTPMCVLATCQALCDSVCSEDCGGGCTFSCETRANAI